MDVCLASFSQSPHWKTPLISPRRVKEFFVMVEAGVTKEQKRLEGIFQTTLWFFTTWTQRSILCVFSKIKPLVSATCNRLLPTSF